MYIWAGRVGQRGQINLQPLTTAVGLAINHALFTPWWSALALTAPADSFTSLQDIQHYQQMLDGIDRRRQEGGGVFCGSLKEGRVPEGQAVASDLLASCYSLVEALKDTAGDLGASLTPIYRQMSGIHHGLEDLRRKPGGYTTTDIARLQVRVGVAGCCIAACMAQ